MKFGVLIFPGSNCDRDVVTAVGGVLRQPVRQIWHEETHLGDVDVVIVPGGFSYGDYLRCGAIARFSPVMQAVKAHAANGGYVLGICNGFQILTEVGLLPGALVRNRGLHFICDRMSLRIERTDLIWTQSYHLHQIVTLPIAHGEGCYYADRHTLETLEANRQVVLRYCDNPNGSLADIAGICNREGNVVGMMPHPERAMEKLVGGNDGRGFFAGLLAYFAQPQSFPAGNQILRMVN